MISVGKRVGGFTIIEVMIVLASTGALLLIAMTVIGGQVASTSFQTSSRSFATELQNIANQVTSGQYIYNNFSCSLSGGAATISTVNGLSQGQNVGCDFLGKNIYIPSLNGSNTIKIYSVAGPSANTISNKDTVINVPESVDSYVFNDSNMSLKCIYYDNDGCLMPQCGIGLLSVDNSINNGSEFDMYAMQGANSATCSLRNSKTFRDGYFGSTIGYPKKISSATFCLQQMGSSRKLGIQISSNSSNTTQANIQGSGFSVDIVGNASC